MNRKIIRTKNFAADAANFIVDLAHKSLRERNEFRIALSGGNTPRPVYARLGTLGPDLPWELFRITFGDERCVPPDDAESNYRMTNEAMLSHLPIPPGNVRRIQGVGDAVANARLYEDELRTFFNDASWPRFDLVLLGMGDDGHTASLFPGSAALNEQQAWVAANWVEKFNAYRITLTVPAINHAAHIAFLVTGENKAERLSEVLSGESSSEQLPSQLIKPLNGSLEWLIDKAAKAGMRDKG